MTDSIRAAAPKILELVQASKNILLHCHPSADPDSVGSALAMKAALRQLGKNATAIRGDTPIPEAFSHFPGFGDIVQKNFFEINPAEFDLFIIQDSGGLDRVSQLGPVVFPPTMKTVVIDHHKTTPAFARDINLIEPTYPATCLILFELFKLWNIALTPDVAANLFIGMYTDTGGFKYDSVGPEVFTAAAELSRAYPAFPKLIADMENSRTPGELIFQGLALSHIETTAGDRAAIAAISAVSYADLQAHAISSDDTSASLIAHILRSVVGWNIGVGIVEMEPGKVKVSFRTRDSKKYDLSAVAQKLGGGGHRAAAAAIVSGTLTEVKEKVIAAVKESML